MCGIAGILNYKNIPADESIIRRMSDCMRHRGPDSDGFYVNREIALGHRRLAIIDLSEEANCPLTDHTGRYILIFNGEMYNFREVKEQLPDYPYKTNGDSEVILAAYSKWGPAGLEKFAGMFALAIWDNHTRELFVARDRMGVKPLYYYDDGERLLFASEIRGLLKSGLVPRKVNKSAIDDFLEFQSVGFPHSIIQNIVQLEAGCWMRAGANGIIEIKKYWDITQSRADFDFSNKQQVQQRLQFLLQQSVQRRLISDVPLGAFLSGGIDSSAVVGLMARTSTGPVNTFTIGFDEKAFDESEYAALIAKKFNTRHTTVKVQPKLFLDELPHALDSMDSPSGDGVNTYVVSKKIRQSGLIVALSGVGGDELFAGYPFFPQYHKLRRWKGAWNASRILRQMAAGFIRVNGSMRHDRLKQLLQSGRATIDECYPIFRQINSPRMIGKLTTHEVGQHSLVAQQLEEKHAAIEQFPDLSQVSIAEYLGYTQHTLLKDTDQMSMAVSLEVREPFFDHELVEFVLNIPDKWKYPAYPKSLLVESLGDLLPHEVVHRKKQGFVFPWELWMKQELRGFCEERINRLASRDFMVANQVHARWNQFLKSDGSVRWMEIWLLVILEYWLEKNAVE
ncbi:MAG TPA: asparagine synthase (glutamine-hydrolyzing) [Chitinophagaceae bacterium]|nr:asparagine synthase (glutamine-hydrolyzing) [Chitinophagaceae bacterium]